MFPKVHPLGAKSGNVGSATETGVKCVAKGEKRLFPVAATPGDAMAASRSAAQ